MDVGIVASLLCGACRYRVLPLALGTAIDGLLRGNRWLTRLMATPAAYVSTDPARARRVEASPLQLLDLVLINACVRPVVPVRFA